MHGGAVFDGCPWRDLPNPAPAFDTGCGANNFGDAFYYDAAGHKMVDDERYNALAMRLSTPVYQDLTGTAPAARPLVFSERVRIMN